MMAHRVNIRGILTILIGLAAGVGLIALFVANRQSPPHDEGTPPVPTLAVIAAQPLPFRLVARGYGVARPGESWQATANVAGKVVLRHPDLEGGKLLPADTLLLALDPSRYQLAIAAAQADIDSLAAEQRQLVVEEENTRRLLELERQRLSLAERELARIDSLAGGGAVSGSQLDEQLRATLAQRQAVTALSNQLALIPSRRQRLAAQGEQSASRLGQARRDLDDSRFFAPYDLRVNAVEVALHQNVAMGQRLFQADSIETAEVETQVPLTTLRRLMTAVPRLPGATTPFAIGDFFDFSSIQAEVELVGVDGVSWPGRVSRVASGLDPGTRTARLVVVVDQPYRHAEPPLRPILQRDMYLRVHLFVESPEPLLVVPAAALHQGELYLVDGRNRLERRPVAVAFVQRDLAVIDAGLAPGEQVIVDDPLPALGGMPVDPRRDLELETRLRHLAAGEWP